MPRSPRDEKVSAQPYELVWLEEMERRISEGESIDYRSMLVALRDVLPRGFKPSDVNPKLVYSNGPSVFGLAAIGDKAHMLPDVERTIDYIQRRVIDQPSLTSVSAPEIADGLNVPIGRAERLLMLAASIADFNSGAVGSDHGYSQVHLGREDGISSLLAFKDLRTLMQQSMSPPSSQQVGWVESRRKSPKPARGSSGARRPTSKRPSQRRSRSKAPRELRAALGSYRLGAKIGEGGAGIVYEATDVDGRPVAIKLLDPQKANADRLKRFKNEYVFCFRHSHDQLLRVLDFGVTGEGDDAVPFYVMPRYRVSLRQLMQDGVPSDSALKVFGLLLNGVEAAHARGVIHRDLKPENVLANDHSDIVVADFGIARFEEEELITAVETKDHARLANFQYAAPEQRKRGGAVTQATDIFALGLILNEMFTGDVPLGADFRTVGSVLADLAWIDAVITEMIQSSPDRRPQSVQKVRELLSIRSDAPEDDDGGQPRTIPAGSVDAEPQAGPTDVVLDGTAYSWSRSLISLRDLDPMPEPAGLLDALRSRGMTPSWARRDRLSAKLAEGKHQLFATDHRTWRRTIVQGDTVLIVKLSDAYAKDRGQLAPESLRARAEFLLEGTTVNKLGPLVDRFRKTHYSDMGLWSEGIGDGSVLIRTQYDATSIAVDNLCKFLESNGIRVRRLWTA